MSKFVLQTFHVTDAFLQGVRQKASMYPEDITLSKVNLTLVNFLCVMPGFRERRPEQAYIIQRSACDLARP